MLDYELEYYNNGITLIAGVDEAGRGPLAGPVCVAACIMPMEKDKIIEEINDSKKLSEKKREELYDKIVNTAISYKIELISEKVIDEINILNATKMGMKQAIIGLNVQPELVLIDAVPLDIGIKTESIIKRAIDIGVDCLTFTDHLEYNTDHFSLEISKYTEQISKYKEKYSDDIELLTGIEVG